MTTGSWSRNLRWTVVGEVAGKGAVFITNIILARALGTSGLGMLAAAQAFAAYLWIAADLGVGFYGAREVAKDFDGRARIVSSLLGLRLTSGLIAAVCGASGAILLFDDATELAYALAATQVLFLAVTLDWPLRGTQHFQALAKVSAVGGAVLITGSLGVAALPGATQDKIPLFLGVWVLAQATMAVHAFMAGRSLIRTDLVPSRADWHNHLRRSAFFALTTGIVTAAQYLPILALNHLVGSEATGVFSAPYRLVLTVISAVYMLTSSAYPILSASHATDQQQFSRQFTKTRSMVLGTAITAALVMAILSSHIVHLLFGTGYEASAPILAILGFLVPFVSLRAVYGTALLASGAERLHLAASATGMALWVVVGAPLIFKFGVDGAAWTCLASEGIVVATMAQIFKKRCVLKAEAHD